MHYCRKCGAKIQENDSFCRKCGEKAGINNQKENTFESYNTDETIDTELQNKPIYKVCIILAYFGAPFWLPIIFFPKEKNSKYYSNQGLWVLILSCIACWGIRIIHYMNNFFFGSYIFWGGHSIVFIIFLIFMTYLFVMCIKSVYEISKNKKPASIWFFEKQAIIK